ncbi:MAG TPA: type VI secretion system baseplate subunit TssF [Steroidobacteraceae bacterium]|nr:type VI secretion system baseplate subunit TssF [Steroidobacteraceae bacterium]
MADELLPYYNQELVYLMRLGAEFAEQHPAAAGRLRMSADTVEDPHVSRLLQGVAFLNARIRRKLDDEFPELTHALLGQLYPHYLAPIPPMSIFAFTAERDLDESRVLPAGSEIESEAVGGEACTFRTTQDVTVWPIEIEGAALTGRPLRGPVSPRGCVSVLRLALRCMAPQVTFAQLQPDSLRFFLRGSLTESLRLYELIYNNTAVVAVAEAGGDAAPLLLNQDSIRPVGFGASEGVLPYRASSSMGYRLLTEYFTFPQKFLFFELTGLASKLGGCASRKCEIFLYLNRSAEDLESSVSVESFALGCAPVVNLFRQRTEPIRLDQSSVEYHVLPDSRRQAALEVYSVDNVTVTTPAGEVRTYAPFFGLTHGGSGAALTGYWHAARRATGGRDPGSEIFLSFVDSQGEPAYAGEAIASVETTCLNRDVAAKLPFGGGRPQLKLTKAVPGVAGVAAMMAPTPTLRLSTRKDNAWRLISHLNLNHLTLSDDETGAEALREMLRLYDFRDAAETQAMIDSVLSVRSRRGTARAPDAAMGALCRGLDITVEFDEQRASGAGIFLFAAVLERFMAHFASINAFTRFTAAVKGRTGVLRTWPPRAGDLTLL